MIQFPYPSPTLLSGVRLRFSGRPSKGGRERSCRDAGDTEPPAREPEAAGPAEVQGTRGAGGVGRAAEHAAPVPRKILYPRGPVGGIPEEYAGRRERFLELDALESGWTVELRGKDNSSIMDAVFFSPHGQEVGPFANARRAALTAHKKAEALAPGA